MSRAIVIFARSPRAEALAKHLDQTAVRLFEAVTREWAAVARQIGAEVLISCDQAYRADFARLGCSTSIEQTGETFGARLSNAGTSAFRRGFATVAITGIDAPPPAVRELELAFGAVESGDAPAAIAPAHDGGVNLIVLQAHDVTILSTFVAGAPDLARRCRTYFGDTLRVLAAAVDLDSMLSIDRMLGEVSWRRFRGLMARPPVAATRVFAFACVTRTSSTLRAPPGA